VASLAFNAPGTVAVGASAAVMGTLAMGLLLTFRMPKGEVRSTARLHLLYWLVPALLPLITGGEPGVVDMASHVGGAVMGLLLGALWLPRRDHGRMHQALAQAGRVLAVLCTAALAWATAHILNTAV